MRAKILNAFSAVSCGYSADRIIADPQLNAAFVAECRRLGLDNPPKELNKALLSARKQGDLAGKSQSQKTSFKDVGEYQFASEVAVRFLEQRLGMSLDDIICDPDTASEFDQIAAAISPGFDSLRYRWAALNLRKARKLRPEIVSRIATFEAMQLGKIGQTTPTTKDWPAGFGNMALQTLTSKSGCCPTTPRRAHGERSKRS